MSARRDPRRHQRGSAAVELLATIPLLVALAIVSWYLASGLVAAMDANEALVRAGLDETGASGARSAQVEATRVVPALGRLPALEVTARARVRPR
jgi:hypothetical protein